MANSRPHLLVIDAPYYTKISESLMEGVTSVLNQAEATHDYITVPGVLEIPAAISIALCSHQNMMGLSSLAA